VVPAPRVENHARRFSPDSQSRLSKRKDQLSCEEEQAASPNDSQDASPDHETERKPMLPSAGRVNFR
jgi:hypothetical protein